MCVIMSMFCVGLNFEKMIGNNAKHRSARGVWNGDQLHRFQSLGHGGGAGIGDCQEQVN